jgi:hypothetical protein
VTTDIGRKLAQLEKRLAAVERQSRLGSASVDNTALEIRDQSGSLRGLIGQQADGTTAVNITNGPTPPTPSAPVVESALAALTVTWDGTFADGAPAPLDWMRVEVHVGATSDFSPDQNSLRDTIETPQGGSVVVPLPYAEWHIKLRSRSTSGVASPATAAVAGTPRKAEAADITAGSIQADHIAVDALTGKTVTGGVVTGAIVQTSGTGRRIVLDPTGLDGKPVVRLYTASTPETDSASLYASVRGDTAHPRPYVTLQSPAIEPDPDNQAYLTLLAGGGTANDQAEFDLGTGNGSGGTTRIYAYASDGGANRGQLVSSIYEPVENAYAELSLSPDLLDWTDIHGKGFYFTSDGSPLMHVQGALSAESVTLTNMLFSTYTPVVAGGGTATYTSRTGWYWKLGKLVFFNCEFTVGTAGSGTSIVTVTAPTAIDRSSRQVIPLHAKGAWTSGMAANGTAVSLETGTGNVIDHLSMSNDNALNRDGILAGVNLLATARISISGWYREA